MVKVTVFGASGGIGQSLSLLLKLDQRIDQLALYDVVNTVGVGQDLSHIDTTARVESFLPENEGLQKSLQGTDLVIIPAGVPRKPGMTRDDLFKINGGIIRDLLFGISQFAPPDVFVLVISNPVNSTVAIVSEVLKKQGVYDPKRVIGVNTLDQVRAHEFLTQLFPQLSPDPTRFIPVVGGHSGDTIVPLYSIGAPELYLQLSNSDRDSLIHRVQYGGDEVVKLKNGAGSATLSMAYAGYKIASLFLQVLANPQLVVDKQIGFIGLDTSIKNCDKLLDTLQSKYNETQLKFLAAPIRIDKNGINSIDNEVFEICNENEAEMIKIAIDQLKKNVEKGVEFVKTGQVIS